MLQAQRNVYMERTVQTATPAQLLFMLYDGAIRFSRKAIDAIENKEYQDANESLLKVQAIVNEFIITLDRTSPLADQLLHLYDYFNRRLVEANLKKEVEPIQEVLGYLTELRETWVQASRTIQGNKASTGTQHA